MNVMKSVRWCAQVTNEPFYNVLRTNEQLGYSVHCGLRLTHSALGFAFVVVSGECISVAMYRCRMD